LNYTQLLPFCALITLELVAEVGMLDLHVKWRGNVIILSNLNPQTTTIGKIKTVLEMNTGVAVRDQKLLGFVTKSSAIIDDSAFLASLSYKCKPDGILSINLVGTPLKEQQQSKTLGSDDDPLPRQQQQPAIQATPQSQPPATPVLPDNFIPTGRELRKLAELSSRLIMHFVHPPRKGKKLLILDLDHTIMHFDSRDCNFDYVGLGQLGMDENCAKMCFGSGNIMVTTNGVSNPIFDTLPKGISNSANHNIHDMKRPYMEQFLKAVYPYYDIGIWSQTHWRWIEIKLAECGMLHNSNYKICFVLDKSFMFKIPPTGYVKPLHIIWSKYGNLWSPKNTLHIDDMERNFLLNRESGVLVAPFYRPGFAPTDTAPAAATTGVANNGATTAHISNSGIKTPPPPNSNGGLLSPTPIAGSFPTITASYGTNGVNAGTGNTATGSNSSSGPIGSRLQTPLGSRYPTPSRGDGNSNSNTNTVSHHLNPPAVINIDQVNASLKSLVLGGADGNNGTTATANGLTTDDDELYHLANYLISIATVEDVTAVSHGNWRDRIVADGSNSKTGNGNLTPINGVSSGSNNSHNTTNIHAHVKSNDNHVIINNNNGATSTATPLSSNNASIGNRTANIIRPPVASASAPVTPTRSNILVNNSNGTTGNTTNTNGVAGHSIPPLPLRSSGKSSTNGSGAGSNYSIANNTVGVAVTSRDTSRDLTPPPASAKGTSSSSAGHYHSNSVGSMNTNTDGLLFTTPRGTVVTSSSSSSNSTSQYNNTYPISTSKQQPSTLSPTRTTSSSGNRTATASSSGSSSTSSNFISNLAQAITGSYSSATSSSSNNGVRAQSARILRSSSDGNSGSAKNTTAAGNTTITSASNPSTSRAHHHTHNYSDGNITMPSIATTRSVGDDGTPRYSRK
jgi:ubiquitin-like domain-containing CTD phosphatase 1